MRFHHYHTPMPKHRWTEQDDRRILEAASEFGPSRVRIAAALKLPLTAVNNRIEQVLHVRYREAVDGYHARMAAQREVAPVSVKRGDIVEVLTMPPAPFATRIAAPAIKTTKNAAFTAVVYGDTHVPFHDPAAVRVVQGIAKDVKPDVLLNVGDLVDAWQISRFDKDPTRKDSLQDNIDEARQHLHEMAQVVPRSRRVLLEGNHENRLGRLIASLEGAHRELPKLRAFQNAMTWPALLELDGIGFEWVPERVQSKTPILPKIITKHGTVVRKWSGATAAGEWQKYGASGLSGHTHRLGHFLHRDHNGTASWIETGCTCLLDPPYGTDYDWQQGCVVLSWNADRRLMQTEVVSMRDGCALYKGQEYHG